MSLFLEEQLDRVFLFENVEKTAKLIKSKAPAIMRSMETGNLLQTRRLLNAAPDTSLEEISEVAHAKVRNFHKHHLEAKRLSKGDSTQLQKIFVLSYGCMKAMKESNKDKTAMQSFDDALLKLRGFAIKNSNLMLNDGLAFSSLLFVIGFFFRSIPIISKIAYASAQWSLILGLLLLILRFVLNIYFSLKGIK